MLARFESKLAMSNVVGWIAVVLVTSISAFWSFWGIVEAFHEGWCKPQLWMRLLQLLAYLSIGTTLWILCVVGICWPRIGACLFLLIGAVLGILILVDQSAISGFILFSIVCVPATVGILFLFGRPQPQRVACAVAISVPVLTALLCGIEPAIRVSNRFDDGNRSARLLEGNGVKLLWAPAGPGWTREGNVTWPDAKERVRHLSADGLSLEDERQDLWRLPTRKEIVHSLTRSNRNAGGSWNVTREEASYHRTPDKESPIWDRYAPLIYLWTDEEKDSQSAWIVVYHGGIYSKPKGMGAASLGFRAVRELP